MGMNFHLNMVFFSWSSHGLSNAKLFKVRIIIYMKQAKKMPGSILFKKRPLVKNQRPPEE